MLTSVLGFDGLLLGTVVPFLFVLTVVVFVHEMGHYLVGRWCGIGVRAFSIGFGPELVGFNDRTGTRWRLAVIPLGGYVKFVGDVSATSSPTGVDQEELSEEERKVAFHTQAIWKRALTVAAGPVFNFILTIAVFSVMFSVYGRFVSEPMVAQVRADGPAAAVGFQPGDRFVSLDGTKVDTFADVQRYVSVRAGEPIRFVLMRGDSRVELTATPEIREQTDPLGNVVKVGMIGVANDESLGKPRIIEYGPIEAVGQAVLETGFIAARTGQFLKRFVMGREDKCQLGGPVKIADMAGRAAKKGFDWLVQLVALLSIGIGILNLLPIPPLDGGHLVFYGVEAALGRPVSEYVLETFYRAGLILVLMFMAFVFWNDLFAC